jgi:hypothetical protein
VTPVDIVVVGSGPAGVNAAKKAVDDGLEVTLIDVGLDEPELRASIPPQPFATLRSSDPGQRRYFLGEEYEAESARNDRLSSHLTAPRAYVTRGANERLPVESDTFFPVQSLAKGGLGAGWGAESQTYETFELEQAGLPAAEMATYYDEVIREIGVSGGRDDDTAEQVLATCFAQRAPEVDSNARSLLAAYREKRIGLNRRGFTLGRESLAMLTEPLPRPGVDRKPNPYTDMDFYGAADNSIYRPEYTLTELRTRPNFRYLTNALVRAFCEDADGIDVAYDRLDGGAGMIRAKKVLLAAGALNSARIVLRSLKLYGVRLPLLSNVMHYMPCINLAMLGRAADNRRHSLGQVCGVYTPGHRAPEHVIVPIVSYRSLLHFRIVAQMPVPIWLGLLISRVLLTSLTIVGIHHPERPSAGKWIELRQRADSDVLAAGYELSAEEKQLIGADNRGLIVCLLKLRCLPLALFSTVPGASIHYAGTIPREGSGVNAPVTSTVTGKLNGSRHVFLADSATWTALPAKGPTLTIMANARRIAHEAMCEIRLQTRGELGN